MSCGYNPEEYGAQCHRCPLRKDEAAGPVAPEYHETAEFIVVGDAPEDAEITEGRPFVGPDNYILTKTLAQVGVKRQHAHWTLAVLCQPPNNDMKRYLAKIQSRNSAIKRENATREEQGLDPLPLIPTPQECCRPRLAYEVKLHKNILTLGGSALRAVTGATASILELRGGTMHGPLTYDEGTNTLRLLKNDTIHEDVSPDAVKCLPTVSPTFTRFAKKWTEPFKVDLARAVRWFRGQNDWKPPEIVYQPDAETLREFLATLDFPTYDLETDGIEPTAAKIRCIGIGSAEKVHLVGLLSKDGVTRFYSPMEELRILAVLRDVFRDPTRYKVGHNSGSYDRICVRHQWHKIAWELIEGMLNEVAFLHGGESDAYREAEAQIREIWPDDRDTLVDVWPNLDTILLHRLVASELPHRLSFVGSMYTNAPSWKCYDGETEVLTERGWVPFPALQRGESVAQWEDGKIQFVQPRAYVDQPYAGPMWRLKSQALDLLVTPDHKMVYRDRHRGKIQFAPVQDLPSEVEIPHTGILHREENAISPAFIQFLVAVQADGSWVRAAIDFGFTKTRKIDRLLQILDTLGIPYRCKKTGTKNPRTRIWVLDHPLVQQARELLTDKKVFGPWLLQWPIAARLTLLDELPFWDGTKGAEHTNYNSIEPENVAILQACAVLSGRPARMALISESTGKWRAGYRLSLPSSPDRSRCWSRFQAHHRTQEMYAGRIYCVSVPSGYIVVRRGGKVTVSGNTDRAGRKIAFDAESDGQLHEYCIARGTPIHTSEGMKPIQEVVDNKLSLPVLSFSEKGGLCYRKVIAWHKRRDEAAQWVQIHFSGERQRERGLICTRDHVLIGPTGEKPAECWKPGDLLYHAEPLITAEQRACVVGTLLGDTILVFSPVHRQDPSKSPNASLLGGHSENSGFSQAKVSDLPFLSIGNKRERGEQIISGRRCAPTSFLPLISPMLRQLGDLYPLFYDKEGERRLYLDTVKQAGPRGWAWWFMDDGTATKRNNLILIATRYPKEDVEVIRDYFSSLFGCVWVDKKNRLIFSVSASRSFGEAIAPFLPPIARKKLPGGLAHLQSLPYHAPEQKKIPSLRQVVSVQPYEPKNSTEQYRYCITVEETHNFFTSYGLVKNCGLDVSQTATVMPILYDLTHKAGQDHLIEDDHQIQEICTAMHQAGMYIDQPLRAKYEKEQLKEIVALRDTLRRAAGNPSLNPGSTHQLRRLLYEEWKLKPILDDKLAYTLSGDPSTADPAIRGCLALRSLPENQIVFLKALRNYRAVQKKLGTYTAKLRPQSEDITGMGWDADELAEEFGFDVSEKTLEGADFFEAASRLFEDKEYSRKGIVWPDGRMRPGYNAHVAVTGRLSSSKPLNAQNFPKDLRKLIRAQPGHILVGADADQLELRIAAARWACPLYLGAFAADADPHSMTAAGVFGDDFLKAPGWPEGDRIPVNGFLVPRNGAKFASGSLAERCRKLAKIVQYLSQYGGSPEAGLQALQQTEDDKGELIYLHFQLRQYRQMHQSWLQSAKEFPLGWQKEVAFFRKYGFIQEPVARRRRLMADGEDFNAIVNFPIQGAASSLMNRAMIAIYKEIPLHKWGPGTGIITMTHDALVVECPDDGVEITQDAKGKYHYKVSPGSPAAFVASVIESAMNQKDASLPGVSFTASADFAMTWDKVG